MKRWMMLVCLALVLVIPVHAAGTVSDEAGILSQAEALRLEARAKAIEETYGFGVYIATVADFSGADIYTFTTEWYLERNLGVGADGDGILLLLSMAERDYALVVHGQTGQALFTNRNQDVISEHFLDDFRDGRWADGFTDYLEDCEALLEDPNVFQDEPVWEAGGSDPVYESYSEQSRFSVGKVLVVLAVSLLAAGITCGAFYGQMRTAKVKSTANDYMSPEGLKLTVRQDIFTHRTEHRRTIDTETHSNSSHSGGGGGTHHSGGGFSGKSGKF